MVREHVPVLTDDRVLAPDIAAIADVMARERFVAAVRVRVPDLQ